MRGLTYYFVARYYASAQGRFTSADTLLGSVANPQTLNRYSYAGNNPLKNIDPTGHEFYGAQFNGGGGNSFDNPNNDPSKLPEKDRAEIERVKKIIFDNKVRAADAEYAAWQQQHDNAHEYAHVNTPQETVQGYSSNSIMAVIWAGIKDSWNPDRWFGHVSYITMQDDTSYSWQGIMNWTIDHPSAKYTDKRSMDSAGMGYLLDFGPALNAKFQKALLSAYDSFTGVKYPYEPIGNNCGSAFNVAINAIRKEIGVPKSNSVLPSKIEAYIKNTLVPRGFVVLQTPFPKH